MPRHRFLNTVLQYVEPGHFEEMTDFRVRAAKSKTELGQLAAQEMMIKWVRDDELCQKDTEPSLKEFLLAICPI